MSRNLSVDEPVGVKIFYGAVIGLCALLTAAVLRDLGTRPASLSQPAGIATVAEAPVVTPGFGAAS